MIFSKIKFMIFSFLLFGLISSAIFADETNNAKDIDDSAIFAQANEYYLAEQYSTAIDYYEKLIEAGYIDARVFFNVANAYYRIGNIAPAILNYERAKKLAPYDNDIDFNLRIANLQIIDRIEPIPQIFYERWFDSLLLMANSDFWAIMVIIFVWLSFIFLFLFVTRYSPAIKKLFFALALFSIVITSFSYYIGWQRTNFEKSQNHAIIFSPSVYVKSSPEEAGTNLFLLHEGTKVRLKDRVGTWNKIEIEDGNVGWIESSAFVVI
jgi:tetratricopeptide (TPR) repeat protein